MKHTNAFIMAALAGLSATGATAITPPGTPPTFYCDVNRPANADKVETQLNTRAKDGSPSDADRGNQPRWEYATPSFYSATPASPATLPTGLTWTAFDGHSLDRYAPLTPQPNRPFPLYPGLYVGLYPPASPSGLPQNHVHYFRYRFRLDATVTPDTYKIELPQGTFTENLPAPHSGTTTVNKIRADDNIVGIYLNGHKINTAPYGSSPATSLTLGGGITPDKQWKTGENELIFAIYDVSLHGAVWLGINEAKQTHCDWRPAPSPAPVPTLPTWGLPLLGGLLAAATAWRRKRG